MPARNDLAFSPRLSALRTLNEHVSLTGSVYRAFRAPTLNELYRTFRVGNVVTLNNAALNAERLTGAEVRRQCRGVERAAEHARHGLLERHCRSGGERDALDHAHPDHAREAEPGTDPIAWRGTGRDDSREQCGPGLGWLRLHGRDGGELSRKSRGHQPGWSGRSAGTAQCFHLAGALLESVAVVRKRGGAIRGRAV